MTCGFRFVQASGSLSTFGNRRFLFVRHGPALRLVSGFATEEATHGRRHTGSTHV